MSIKQTWLVLTIRRTAAYSSGVSAHCEGWIALSDWSVPINSEFITYSATQPRSVVLVKYFMATELTVPVQFDIKLFRCAQTTCQDWSNDYYFVNNDPSKPDRSELGLSTYLNAFFNRVYAQEQAEKKTYVDYYEDSYMRRPQDPAAYFGFTAQIHVDRYEDEIEEEHHPGMIEIIKLQEEGDTYIGMLKQLVDGIRVVMGFDLNLGYFQTANSQEGIVSTLSNYGIPVNLIPATIEFMLRRSSNGLGLLNGEGYVNQYSANNVLNDAQLLGSLMFIKGNVLGKPIKSAVANMIMYAYAQKGFDQVVRSVYGGLQQALPDIASTAIALPLKSYPSTNQIFTHYASPYVLKGLGFLSDISAMYLTKKVLQHAVRSSPMLTNGIGILSTLNNNRMIRNYIPLAAELVQRSLYATGPDYMSIVERMLQSHKQAWYDDQLGTVDVSTDRAMNSIRNYLFNGPNPTSYKAAQQAVRYLEETPLSNIKLYGDKDLKTSAAFVQQSLSEFEDVLGSLERKIKTKDLKGIAAQLAAVGIARQTNFPQLRSDYYNVLQQDDLLGGMPVTYNDQYRDMNSDWADTLSNMPATQKPNYLKYIAGLALMALTGYGLYNSGDYIGNLYNKTTSYYPQRKRDSKYSNKTSEFESTYSVTPRYSEIDKYNIASNMFGHWDHLQTPIRNNTISTINTLNTINNTLEQQPDTQPEQVELSSVWNTILNGINDNKKLIGAMGAMSAGAIGAGYMMNKNTQPSPILEKIERIHDREYPALSLYINKELRQQQREFRQRDINRFFKKIQAEEEDEWLQKRKAKPKHIGNGHGIKRRKH